MRLRWLFHRETRQVVAMPSGVIAECERAVEAIPSNKRIPTHFVWAVARVLLRYSNAERDRRWLEAINAVYGPRGMETIINFFNEHEPRHNEDRC